MVLAGFLVGGVIGTAGKGTTTTVTHEVQGPPVTQVQTVTAPANGKTVTRTNTVTVTAPATAAPAAGASSSSSQTFNGNGARRLGTVKVATDSTLKWTNDGPLISVLDDSMSLGVNSQGHSGESAIAAGTYTNVMVNAMGNWTISIVPNG